MAHRAGEIEAWAEDSAFLPPSRARKGRGATINPAVRFDAQVIAPFDDGWETLAAEFGARQFEAVHGWAQWAIEKMEAAAAEPA